MHTTSNFISKGNLQCQGNDHLSVNSHITSPVITRFLSLFYAIQLAKNNYRISKQIFISLVWQQDLNQLL